MVCALLTQDYVSKLTHLLLATEGDSSGAARRIIHELVEAQRWAVQALARNDRHSMMRMSVEMKRGPQAQQALQLMQARRSGDTARRSLVRDCYGPGEAASGAAMPSCMPNQKVYSTCMAPRWQWSGKRTCEGRQQSMGLQ